MKLQKQLVVIKPFIQMQTNLLWTGREYYSLENCLVTSTDHGTEVNSAIVGQYEGKLYRVEYTIKTSHSWETIYCTVQCQHDNVRNAFVFERYKKGRWTMNGMPAHQFDGCHELDIPLTPFTNTLPINRLKLLPGQEADIGVIYIDLLQQEISAVKQKYRRVSKDVYHYENIPNDFEADIEVDERGLVVDYPSLFVRTARIDSHYEMPVT